MSRQVTKTIYTFDELSDEAKERAINDWNAEGLEYDWWEFVYSDAKEIGRLLGVTDMDINFSGFWSQGDGACFTGRYAYRKGSVREIKDYAPMDLELHRIAEALFKAQARYFFGLTATITQGTHRYSHEHSVSIAVENERENNYRAAEDVEESIAEPLRDLMRWIYRTLEKEYEYQTSDEVVTDTILANDYEFTAAGKMVFCQEAGKSLQSHG